jgi:hypothetical protein
LPALLHSRLPSWKILSHPRTLEHFQMKKPMIIIIAALKQI